MGSKDEWRIFVGGLSWNTSERHLEDAFSRYGKVIETQIMLDRDSGRPRGFGFVTFSDQRGMEDSIAEMHGRELDGRVISVNKAEPKVGSDASGYGNSRSYSSGGRGGGYESHGADRPPPAGRSDCFKCGRPGHWARECPSADGDDGGRFSSRSKFSGVSGGPGSRGDRFGGSDRYGDRYDDDRYDAGRYGDRDRVDSRDSKYSGGRDRYGNDRYPPPTDRFSGDRYGGSDRYPQNSYGKERGFERDGGSRVGGGGGSRYSSGGPTRYEGGGGYRERPGPYDRPSRGGRPPSYDDRY